MDSGLRSKGMSQSFQQRIMDAAYKIFTENGYRQADMRSIAREAGIAVGTIYNYYPNKAVLYQAILAQHSAQLDQQIFDITRDKQQIPMEKLRLITDCLLEFVARHTSFWHEIFEDPNRDVKIQDEGYKAQMKAHEQLKKHLRYVFAELVPDSVWIERHVLVYIASVTHIGMFFPAEQPMNQQYIMNLVEQMIRQENMETGAST
jgi:AcrR family transcriptional regulator